jgi:hypothetical protein
MADESASWQVLSKRRIYTSQWLSLDLWSLRLPDGAVVTDYPVLDYARPAVAVIPIGAAGRILMIDHYRVVIDRRGWELPAGWVDPGESVDEAARRELLVEQSGVPCEDRSQADAPLGADGSERNHGASLVRRAGDSRARARQRGSRWALPDRERCP